MINQKQAQELVGATLYGTGGEKIGKVGALYLDDETEQPEWVTVKTGLFGSGESFVPLHSATASGGKVTVPFGKDAVKNAPTVEADSDGLLSQEEEAALYRHYGLPYSEAASDSGLPVVGAPTAAAVGSAAGAAAGTHGGKDKNRDGVVDDVERTAVGRDTSGPTTDEAMTRSEEQLRVGTQRVQAGRVKLRKHIVTETVASTVPVTREKATVHTEPITDANRAKAMDGPEITEAEHEVVLTEERPVVDKDVVPVERVRLAKDQVTENVQVNEQVRKEQIVTEGGEDRPRR